MIWFNIILITVLTIDGGIFGIPVEEAHSTPSPIRLTTPAGERVAKLMLDESDYEIQSSPKSLHEGDSNSPPEVESKGESLYAQRKRKRIANLIKKEGLSREEAERKYLKVNNDSQKLWKQANIERRREMNRNAWRKLYPKIKGSRNEHKRKLYQIKQALNPTKIEKGPGRQRYTAKHERHFQQKVQEGLSHSDAKESADKHIEQLKSKDRMRSKIQYEKRKARGKVIPNNPQSTIKD
jgi:hypothetical protein